MECRCAPHGRDQFIDRLPRRPYCTDDPASGLDIRPKHTALRYRHIQPNPPAHVSCLVFDIDRDNGYYAWKDTGLPEPHWASVNRKNGHAHIGYLLATPVVRTNAARLAPLRYLAAIEWVLKRRLGADMGYVGLISKNPVHDDWLTVWAPLDPYTLDYLAEFCPDCELAEYAQRPKREHAGLGRNVELFDSVRGWAYTAVRAYWRPDGYGAWADAVLDACRQANAYGADVGGPLPVNEVRATAKSIAKWVWHRFTPAGFSEVQAKRGAKGGRVSKRPTRSGKTMGELLPEVHRLKASGSSTQDIADQLNISTGSVKRYLRQPSDQVDQ